MKRLFISLAVLVMALCANAQTNSYFWYNGNLMMGNPIAQIDSVTFGDGEPADTLHIMLPRTIIKTVHDTVYITIHDTVCPNVNMYFGHEYVDLGLPSGLLWATCNIGADAPEQAGIYFAWGETQNRTDFTASNYAYAQDQLSISNIAETEYDAARVKWGGEWKMPSREECNELLSSCTLKDTTINGVDGRLVIGTNNNHMFVPCSGHYGTSGLVQNVGVGFWTSTARGSSMAYRMWEWSYISYSQRWLGFPVRPVLNSSAINH